jgi:hypothetical protein
MSKTLTINKCSPEQCKHCYDNGQDIYCSKPDRLGLMNVFPKDSFKDFPKGCPLDDIATIDFINKKVDDIMNRHLLINSSMMCRERELTSKKD